MMNNLLSHHCPVCDSQNLQAAVNLNRDTCQVFVCRSCELEFVVPWQTEQTETPSSITAPAYIQVMKDRYLSSKPVISYRAKERLKFYEQTLGYKPQRILEVGAGAGWMTKEFADLGVETLGLEYDADLVETAISIGANVQQADITNLDTSILGEYDVVFSSQTLEHIFTPPLAIANISALCKTGGIVHIDVPNASSWGSIVRRQLKNDLRWGAIDLPAHQIGYQPKSLITLFEQVNLKEIVTYQKSTDDAIFGQTILPSSVSSKLALKLSHFFGRGYLLVGIARK
jgi:SAM-dependent methyltransferase